MQNELSVEYIETTVKNHFFTEDKIFDIIDEMYHLNMFNGCEEEKTLFFERMTPIYKSNITKAYNFVIQNKKIFVPDINKFNLLCWFSIEPIDEEFQSVNDFIESVEIWAMHVAYYEYSVAYLPELKYESVNRFVVIQEPVVIQINDEFDDEELTNMQ